MGKSKANIGDFSEVVFRMSDQNLTSGSFYWLILLTYSLTKQAFENETSDLRFQSNLAMFTKRADERSQASVKWRLSK